MSVGVREEGKRGAMILSMMPADREAERSGTKPRWRSLSKTSSDAFAAVVVACPEAFLLHVHFPVNDVFLSTSTSTC